MGYLVVHLIAEVFSAVNVVVDYGFGAWLASNFGGTQLGPIAEKAIIA